MEYLILIVVQVLAGIALVALILVQQGKGADMGASFGSGASQTIFGSSGSGNFLTRTTALLATIFFAASLGLAYISKQRVEEAGSVQFSPPSAETVKDEDLPAVSVESNQGDGQQQQGGAEGDLPAVEVQPQTEGAANNSGGSQRAAGEQTSQQQQVEGVPANGGAPQQ